MAMVEPVVQKLPAGQAVLVLLEVHRLPAGHWVATELPASQNVPFGQAAAAVEPETHTPPTGHTSWTVALGQKEPEGHAVMEVELRGQ